MSAQTIPQPETYETLARLIATIQILNSSSIAIPADRLLEKLGERGFVVTLRTLQRDLRKISETAQFGVECDDSKKPFRWHADGRADLSGLMTEPTSLAFILARPILRKLMPEAAYANLHSYFQRADECMSRLSKNNLAKWRNKVRSLPSGVAFKPTEINISVWYEVTTALLHGYQLNVTYRSRSAGSEKKLLLHPLAVVVREGCSYLVAMTNHYEDIKIYAVHRIVMAKSDDRNSAREAKGFDLDEYIESGAFGWASELRGHIRLVADITAELSYKLEETPLSDDQILVSGERIGWLRLEADVQDTPETLWWLISLNANVRVHEPVRWKEEIILAATSTLALYS